MREQKPEVALSQFREILHVPRKNLDSSRFSQKVREKKIEKDKTVTGGRPVCIADHLLRLRLLSETDGRDVHVSI